MLVRSLRPIDVVALASFQRRASATEITAHNWPRVEPESRRVPYLNMVSASLAHRAGWPARLDCRAGWSHRRPGGGASPRGRAGLGRSQPARAPGEDTVAADLLDNAAVCAGSHAARRVFLEAPTGGRGQDVARRAAFERFTSSELYVLAPGTRLSGPICSRRDRACGQMSKHCFSSTRGGAGAGPRGRGDDAGRVGRALPGPQALAAELHGLAPAVRLGAGTSMVGWLEVTFGQRSQFMELLVHPRYEDAADRLVRYALLQVSPKAPVYAVAREYQPHLASALQRAGFRLAAQHELFVKLLAARVREPRLVTANVVGG